MLRAELEQAVHDAEKSWVEAGRELKRLGPTLLLIIDRVEELEAQVEEMKMDEAVRGEY